MSKYKGFTRHTVVQVWRSYIEGTPCMESVKKIGYYTSDYDVRPSSCIWVTKSSCPRLRKIFRKIKFNKA